MLIPPVPPPPLMPLPIELFNLTKRFGAFTALSGVSLKLAPGTLHALLGENGAGKSTLVKCLLGYHRADEGAVIVGQTEIEMTNPKVAHAYGIGMVYQHFTLVPNLTVAENLVLSRDHLPAIIDWRAERAALSEFLATMPFKVPLDKPVAALAAGEKQKIEILKQLYLKRTVVVLDEPTSVLTQDEADEVLTLVRERVVAKQLSVLMISHKFREVMAYADEVTVLRKGHFAGSGKVADLTATQMAEMMMGGTHHAQPAARLAHEAHEAHEVGEVRLAASDVRADDDTGVPVVTGVSFAVRGGEILGVAGVSGNGQKQLVEVLSGQRRATGGTVQVAGQPYRPTRAAMRRHGVHCLPEEPLRNACVGEMTVAENLGLRDFDRPAMTIGGCFVSRARLRRRALELIAKFGIRTPGADAPIGSLSGGNVQRAVLARELNEEVRVLIVANPCFGLDFKAVAEIRTRIMEARNRGVAVILVSEDLDELFELADRLVVMSGGKFVHEALPAATTPTELGRYMAGQH